MCGGKLNGQGICTECGLDNNKSDKNYRLNQSDCDHEPLTHVHEHPAEPKWSNKPKKTKQPKQQKTSKQAKTYERQEQSYNRKQQSYNQQYSQQQPYGQTYNQQQSYSQPYSPQPREYGQSGQNYRKPKKKGGCLRVIITLLVFLIVFGGILIPLISTVRDKIQEYAYQQSDYEKSGPYEYVDNDLPETGSSQTLELASGEYIVGVHIPEGKYSVECEDDYDTIKVDDEENGIYLYEYKGQEDNNLDDIRLYDGARVEIESKTTMKLSTENAQKLNAGEDNPQTAETKLEGGENYIAGRNFEAGVYDLEVTDGTGNLDISITGKSGEEVTTIYMYLGEYSSYGKCYKNLVLPQDSTIKCEGDLSIRLTPSEKIVSTDYADYYEKY